LEPDSVTQLRFTGNYGYLWHELVRECITGGAPLRVVEKLQRTPFCTIFDTVGKYCCVYCSFAIDELYGILNHMLRSWLADLLASGIDLQRCGAEEKPLGMWNQYHHNSHRFSFRLVAFSYGARLEDWQFEFSDLTDEFSGDF
jgi:hypothetical protein